MVWQWLKGIRVTVQMGLGRRGMGMEGEGDDALNASLKWGEKLGIPRENSLPLFSVVAAFPQHGDGVTLGHGRC